MRADSGRTGRIETREYPMKKVLVFGSLNMDVTIECDAMPQAGQTVDGRNYFTNPGGKGGNQAVAAAKLGAPTYMIARVGDDAFGEQMRRSLEGYGVNCDYLSKSTINSTGVAIITRCEGDNRIILSSGANYELTGPDVEAVLGDLAEPLDLFVTQYECEPRAVPGIRAKVPSAAAAPGAVHHV